MQQKTTPKATFTSCPLCDGQQFVPRYHLRELTVFQCLRCQMIFLNPYLAPRGMVALYSDRESMRSANPRLSRYYDHLEGTQTERFFDRCLEKLSQWIPAHGSKLLDVGCGAGYFLSRAQQRGWEVSGVEPSPESNEHARQLLKTEIFEGPFEEYPEEGTFDCVSLWDFIEHVPNPKEILLKAKTLLRDKGILLLATPNHSSFINFLADLFYRISLERIRFPLGTLYVWEHVLYFTEQTVLRLIENSGFVILETAKTVTDIDRYDTGRLFRLTAKCLLQISKWLHWENRIVVFAERRSESI